MLFIKEKDNVRRFKIYVNFRSKTIRVCNYFKSEKIYQVYLPFSKNSLELMEYATYADIKQFIDEEC